MDHGNYLSTVTHTMQDIVTLIKIVTVYIIIVQNLSFHGVREVRKQLHYLLQNRNTCQSRRYIVKYYFSVQFYFLCKLLLNTPSPCTLIILELYYYHRTDGYPNIQIT